MRFAISTACSRPRAIPEGGCARPSSSMTFLNRSRSSASSMLCRPVPISGTPALASPCAKFSGVCPPNCTITPTTPPLRAPWSMPPPLRRSMQFSVSSSVSGSKKSKSLVSKSVLTVSGLELIMTLSRPISAHAKEAWQQQ